MEINNPSPPEQHSHLLLQLVRLSGRFQRRKQQRVNQPFESRSGLNIKAFHVLYLIAGGCQQPGELVSQLGIPNSTATRLLDSLTAEGLIERQPAPQDQRQSLLSLTIAGQQRYTEAMQIYLDCLQTGFGHWPVHELENAIAALSALENHQGSEP